MTLATPAPAPATAAGTLAVIVPNDRNVAACCAEETSGRYSMQWARLDVPADGTRAYVTCTDGRSMTRAAVDLAANAGTAGTHYLPASTLKRAAGKAPQYLTIAGNVATRKGKTGDTVAQLGTDVAFPPTGDIWPTAADVAEGTAVTISAAFLARIADAIGEDDRITLVIQKKKHRPAVVLGAHGVGLIMPIADNGDGNYSPQYLAHLGRSTSKGGA